MNNIRLFVVGINWPPETFLIEKLRGLAAEGMQITAITTNSGSRYVLPGIRVIESPRPGKRPVPLLKSALLILSKLLRFPAATMKGLRYALRAGSSPGQRLRYFYQLLPFVGEQPDILHFEWNSAAISYLPLYDFLAIPIVISCRGTQVQIAPHNPKRKAIIEGLPRSLDKASALHCVSDAIKHEVLKYDLNPANSWVIRPAVDPEFFSPSDSARSHADALNIVMVGSLIWRKGYEYAVHALRLLSDKGVKAHLRIIGAGPEAQRIRYTAFDLEISSQVQLLGKLPPTQVRDQLRQADVFLLASLSEGISNAVLEAMACGLPIVTTDCGGMREAVTDSIEGIVVPVRNPAAMAEALHKLAAQPALRTNMGQAGRSRILRDFILAEQTSQFIQLYHAVLSKQNEGAA